MVAGLLLALALVAGPAAARDQRDLILGGEAVQAAPWQALVYIEGKTDGEARGGRCTGTVIGERWVMTAAHCLTQTEGPDAGAFLEEIFTLVVTGTSDTSLIAELEHAGDQATLDRVIAALDPAFGEDYVISEAWNPVATQFLADIALIRLDRPLAPELGITPARPDQASAFAPGASGEVSGWGLTEGGSVSPLLRVASAPIREDGDCAELTPFGFTATAMICSGEEGPPARGTCRGDSGGPLTAPSPHGVPLVGGITSFGPPNCAQQPTAFTRVATFRELITRVLTGDQETPVEAPEIDAVTLTPGPAGVAALDARIDANGGAVNLELELQPERPAAPLLRGLRAGSGANSRDIGASVGGLAPGVTYAWTAHASGILGRVGGPSGTLAMPGEIAPLDAEPETTRCRPLATRDPTGGSGAIRISRGQLAINQRIGQAALRRLNAIEGWLNAGIVAGDICGGGVGGAALGGIELGRAGAGPEPRPPAPRPLTIPPLAPVDLERFSVSSAQLRTNQRIYQAALRRARALRQRLEGGLTGGDVRDGQLGWDALPPGALMTRLEDEPATPASVTTIRPRSHSPKGRVRVSAGQLRINQKIAQAAVREANALRARIEAGLTGANFASGSITARDFAPEIAARAGVPGP